MSIKPDDMGTRGQGMRACRMRVPGDTKGLSRSTRHGYTKVSAPAHVPEGYGDQVTASLVGCVRENGMGNMATINEHTIFHLMGPSYSVQQIHRQIERVAQTNFTVIVQGETGTGKELIARLIHEASDRVHRPFVAVDCGALPDSIVESELFGYVKGAFTGADTKKAGLFEMAKAGTLFLDEVGNISPTVQMKLLRSLQERRVQPLGSEESITTDVRIVVASNTVLEDEVRAGRFRADLFHRLNEFKIYLLPLRERKEDILFLAERFRHETNEELAKHTSRFSREAQAYLLSYTWEGNVRELRNAVRRAVLLSNDIIELKHVQQVLGLMAEAAPAGSNLPIHKLYQGYGLHDVVHEVAAHVEKSLIEHVLEETRGNKSQAAKRLQIGYKTLYRKLQEYGLH
jgi:DNA-binding NtrC family response regulator